MVVQNNLVLRTVAHGQGVFATVVFTTGGQVLEFHGPRVHRSQLPDPYKRVPDRFLQIEPDYYLGESGEIDDFVNHSCDPNTGIYVLNGTIGLRALRPIAVGDEITFDYSTTMDEDDWEMDCDCGARICRGKIQDFKKLPRDIQTHYIGLDIVPQYIIESLPSGK